MGTRFELVLPPHEDAPADLQAIGELVVVEIEDWHRRLSQFSSDSWIAHVNRTAAREPVRCDDDVWELFIDAQTVWRESEGAFDITRGDGDTLVLDETARTVAFRRAGMALDLGAIGKGHALDCCATLLRAYGVTSAFLHGGTSSGIAIGAGPDDHPWRVGVRRNQTPWRRRVVTVELAPDSAFSVSDAAGQAQPHIVDPRSGTLLAARSVVVTGPSARLCDAWSTALVVLGRAPAHFPIGYAYAETAAG